MTRGDYIRTRNAKKGVERRTEELKLKLRCYRQQGGQATIIRNAEQ